MSLDEEDDFWNSSDVKAFNFDDEDQSAALSTSTDPNANPYSPGKTPSGQSEIKTLGSVLATRLPSDEPFLKPSIIMCDGNGIEAMIDYLDTNLFRPDPSIHVQKIDPKLHIRNIIEKNSPINFSPYKSKRDKLLLLDAAICSSDGNTITAASIFLSRTLKQTLFMEEMKKRPVAADHYSSYLEMTGRCRELEEFTKKLSND